MTTKVCTKCGEEKPLSEYTKERNGTTARCRTCRSIDKKEERKSGKHMFREKHNMNKIWVRECIICGCLFTSRHWKKKTCSQYCGKRNETETSKDYDTKYRSLHLNYIKEYAKEYYNSNNEYLINKTTEYNKAHPEESKKWRKKHKKRSIDELLDTYVIDAIARHSELSYSEVKQHPELIELKREQLLAHRLYKTIKQKCYGKPNAS